ncbi:MAG: hypothetical protein ACLUKN_00530 [Bacilli bacterium]
MIWQHNILLPILIGSAVQADTFYFTRGPEGADSYTRNWSDAKNWDTDGTNIDKGGGWNESRNSTLLPGAEDDVAFKVNSRYNGNNGDTYSLNLDVDAQIKLFTQNDTNDIVTELVSDSGKTLTLSNPDGGVVIDKVRNLNTMTFDVNIVLAQVADKTMTIAMRSDRDVTFNKDIVYKQLSRAFTMGRSMDFLVDIEQPLNGLKESGNIVINGNICNYDADNNPIQLTKGIGIFSDKSLSSANHETEVVGKVIFSGDGYTMGGMMIRNGMVVNFARNNAGAANISGSAIELYETSTINFVKANQLATSTSIQFKIPDSGSKYGGILNMMGNTVDNISYLYFAGFTDNNCSLGKVDFGENDIEQWFVFEEMRAAPDATEDTVWGMDFFNMGEMTILEYCLSTKPNWSWLKIIYISAASAKEE